MNLRYTYANQFIINIIKITEHASATVTIFCKILYEIFDILQKYVDYILYILYV